VKKRLAWILACALLAAFWLPTRAQPPAKMTRIGYLAGVSASADAPRLKAFQQGLHELGYVEGQNVVVEYRHENRELERLADFAVELVRLKPDILVAVTTNAALAARKATTTIPIVFMGVTDPVAAGLVESLARPGGNSTGVTNMAAVLAGKRLEFLKETVPRIARVAVLWDPQAPGSVPQWKESQLAAEKLGLQLHSMEVSNVEDYEGAFKEATKTRNSAVMLTLNPLANSNQKALAELAVNSRLPSICARADYAENGCLMAYGPGYSAEGRDGARYVDRILKGGRPGEIPVEQPTKFEFVVNLKTARRLGVTVPQSVLNQADVVIE
jgi:putative tryptophan/tyrosine transport system substrate-binding protein